MITHTKQRALQRNVLFGRDYKCLRPAELIIKQLQAFYQKIQTFETRKHKCIEPKRLWMNNKLRSMNTQIWQWNADLIVEDLDNLSNNCICQVENDQMCLQNNKQLRSKLLINNEQQRNVDRTIGVY